MTPESLVEAFARGLVSAMMGVSSAPTSSGKPKKAARRAAAPHPASSPPRGAQPHVPAEGSSRDDLMRMGAAALRDGDVAIDDLLATQVAARRLADVGDENPFSRQSVPE